MRRIDRLARLVATDGHVLEQCVMDEIAQNRHQNFNSKYEEWRKQEIEVKGRTMEEVAR